MFSMRFSKRGCNSTSRLPTRGTCHRNTWSKSDRNCVPSLQTRLHMNRSASPCSTGCASKPLDGNAVTNSLPDERPRAHPEPPAMGERRARWGYGFQDKVATARILGILRTEVRKGLSSFEAVRLADLDAWRVDDFVLVWNSKVEGNSIKWSGDRTSINWADLIGAEGVLKEMAEGYRRLAQKWVGRSVAVRLQSNRPASAESHHDQLVTSHNAAFFLNNEWFQG